jgi:hypothetical protein
MLVQMPVQADWVIFQLIVLVHVQTRVQILVQMLVQMLQVLFPADQPDVNYLLSIKKSGTRGKHQDETHLLFCLFVCRQLLRLCPGCVGDKFSK